MSQLINSLKILFLSLTIILLIPGIAQATLPGLVVVDEENFWGQNGRFANSTSKASYVVCNGYIGSPQIPNSVKAVNSFINNCEVTPPPSALPIIDTPENHSRHYQGYPAYEIKPPGADYVYFVCDGFLNSTSWCSYEAHRKATKLRRVAESRYWESGAKPIIINDKVVRNTTNPPYSNKNVTRYTSPNQTYSDGSINRAYPSKLQKIKAQPTSKQNLPQGETVKLQKVPLNELSNEEIDNLDIPQRTKNYIKREKALNSQPSNYAYESPEEKYYIDPSVNNEEIYYEDEDFYVESEGIFDRLKDKFRD